MLIWKPCADRGCSQLVLAVAIQSKHCPEHKRQLARIFRAIRKKAIARGCVLRLRRVGKTILRRDPVCKICNRRPSTHIDYIVPKMEGGTEDPDNLQGLCWPCRVERFHGLYRHIQV